MPAGHTVRKPKPIMLTTVKLSEYAPALVGMPLHGPDGIVYERVSPEEKAGPPKGPTAFRVSKIRQGASPMKGRGLVMAPIVETPRLAP
jgi:hypothetical protein